MKRSKSKIKGIIEAKKNSYGKIPTNTLSGGSRKYDSKDILQYRVWSHPIGKDVVLHTFKTYDQALKKSKELQKRKNLAYVEKPISFHLSRIHYSIQCLFLHGILHFFLIC